ncbi:MAG: hypothetical protein KME25_14810 [Symplocastrum torsivum CPER-KK1]|jgi:hypothetical protein|uniref:Uncharacterized protein n=1 Tax=Symplocastrum torsivum CPER-KK1 TaxID=450513 RepID=A0A951UA68_9CYAN|nr:hypothetical protein [Symplocastrum torsivum CPER-KK1]
MLTASNNIMQEEWVKRWLDRLTPKQKTLVIEILEDSSKHRTPTPAAISLADAVVTDGDSRKTFFNSNPVCPG